MFGASHSQPLIYKYEILSGISLNTQPVFPLYVHVMYRVSDGSYAWCSSSGGNSVSDLPASRNGLFKTVSQ